MKERYRRPPNKEPDTGATMSRRAFFRGIAALGVVGAGTAAYHHFKHEEENLESSLDGERFMKELSGYVAFIRLRHDQVLFVDEYNEPVGPPVDYHDIVAEKIQADGTSMDYLYSPGTPNVDGVYLEPPTLEWREQVIEQLEASPEYSNRTIATSYNVALIFKAALSYDDEPKLQAGIKDGSVATFADIVTYFANKPVLNVDGTLHKENESTVTREQYVRDHIVFRDTVPPELQAALREIIPGICAQESKFNNGLRSTAGAVGIFQFMPWVWEHYGKTAADITSLKVQVEVAGELFSDIYSEVLTHCDDEVLARARQLFTTHEDFLHEFVMSLIINSYNAGSSRVGEAVNAFFTPDRDISNLSGFDVFLAMVDNATESTDGKLDRYGVHARQYVPRVYAHALTMRGAIVH